MNKDYKINLFAKYSFRNMADKEYIIARFAFRSRLTPQFCWSALHSIEKYLKCIRLLKRIEKPKVRNNGHTLRILLDGLEDGLFVIPSEVKDFIGYLDDGKANDRYLEYQRVSTEHHLYLLDYTVWSLRKFCSNYLYSYSLGKVDINEEVYSIINKANHFLDLPVGLFDGYLDSVISSYKDGCEAGINNYKHTYSHLIHENEFFSDKKMISNYKYSFDPVGADNSILDFYPEVISEISKYVKVNK